MRPAAIPVALLLLVAVTGGATAQAVPSVPRYGLFETQLDVPGLPENPYDPDRIAVDGEFTAPSGRVARMPAFYRVEHTTELIPARERLRAMKLLKIYVAPGAWTGGGKLAYVLDDVRLVKTDGSEVVIGDFEADNPRWGGAGVPGRVEGELVHSGRGAFRVDFPPASQAAGWPGIHLDLTGMDWSDVKELRFALYPLTDHARGTVGAEVYAAADDKLQTGFPVGDDGLKVNQWNEVVWNLAAIGDRRISKLLEPGRFFLRFCPSEVGRYRYTVRRAGQEQPLGTGSFECTPSDRPGFLRVAGPRDRLLTFDNGQPLVLVGENVCWPTAAGVADYDRWLGKLAAVGGNYARVWMAPWAFGVEWQKLGRYQQDRAGDLDYVFQLAQKLGIHLMLCLDYHGFLRTQEGSWGTSPYAAANGGPCAGPADFMTSEAAKAAYKKRLRYLVARYAAYDNLLSWELWNEVDLIEGYRSEVVAGWHQEMARYLRSLDPYAHLITTSYAGNPGDARVWSLPEVEYTQIHSYGGEDKAAEVVHWSRELTGNFAKPCLVGEFGVDGGGETERRDPSGLHLHNGDWAGVMAGTMGTAMTWWWDGYVEDGDMYRHWAPLARFVTDLPKNARPLPDEALALAYADPNTPRTYDDVPIEGPAASWEPAPFNTPQTFMVRRDGTVDNLPNLARVLHGLKNHPALHNPPTFQLEFEQPGRFVVTVFAVSGYGGAKLAISLDGKVVLDRDFADRDNTTTSLMQYHGDYAVDVPAGKHTVTVENNGTDWIDLRYRLEGYRPNLSPNCRVLGVGADGKAWIWVQNRQSTWFRQYRTHADPTPIPATRLTVTGVPDGRHEVEVWDTWKGEAVSKTEVRAKGGRLRVDLPGFPRDVAVKVR